MNAKTPATHEATLRNKRLLLVEDEFFVCMMIETELSDRGATVVGSAASVAEALRLIDAAAPDGGLHAAMLDLNLGGETVLPVASRLAAEGVPFVFVTGYDQGCDTGGHQAPMLQKPFVMEELINVLAALSSTVH